MALPLNQHYTPEQWHTWGLVTPINYFSLPTARIPSDSPRCLQALDRLRNAVTDKLRTRAFADLKQRTLDFLHERFSDFPSLPTNATEEEHQARAAEPTMANPRFWDEAMQGSLMQAVEISVRDWAAKEENRGKSRHQWFARPHQPGERLLPSYQLAMVSVLEKCARAADEGRWSEADFVYLRDKWHELRDGACRIWYWSTLRIWQWPLSERAPFNRRPTNVNRLFDETFFESLGTGRHQLSRRVAAMHGIDRSEFARRAAEEVGGW